MSSAVDFIWSDSPLEILGSVTSITFDDPACLPIKDHALTTEEVNYCILFYFLFFHSIEVLLSWNAMRSFNNDVECCQQFQLFKWYCLAG